MLVEISSWYLDTVKSIFENEYGHECRIYRETGHSVTFRFENDRLSRDLRQWCDYAQGCMLIYFSKVTVV